MKSPFRKGGRDEEEATEKQKQNTKSHSLSLSEKMSICHGIFNYLCHTYFNVLNFVVLMYNSKSNTMCMWSKSASDGNYSLEMRYQQFRRALINNLDSRCEVYFPVFCAFRKFKNIKCFVTYFCGRWQISLHTFCFKYMYFPSVGLSIRAAKCIQVRLETLSVFQVFGFKVWSIWKYLDLEFKIQFLVCWFICKLSYDSVHRRQIWPKRRHSRLLIWSKIYVLFVKDLKF